VADANLASVADPNVAVVLGASRSTHREVTGIVSRAEIRRLDTMTISIDKTSLRPGVLAAVTLTLCSSPLLAMSEAMLNLDPYVKEASLDRAVLSHVLMYEHSDFGDDVAKVSASYRIEKGASILSKPLDEVLPPDEYYLPFDMELGFSTPGVFMGSILVEVQTGDSQILEQRHFWIQHTEVDTILISFDEYLKQQRLQAESRRRPTDPYLNLEADDVPGEAKSKVPGCTIDANGDVSCKD
jgi:hypothetical protein